MARDAPFDVVAINDLADPEVLAHLLRYDTTHGRMPVSVAAAGGALTVDNKEIEMLSERDPGSLPWKRMSVDVVIESTGFFTARDDAAKHLDAGAKKVIISAPATNPDITVVIGVNDHLYDRDDHHVISNASCTTNSVAPMAKLLLENFGISRGFMTTVHAYTAEQQLLDQVAVTRKGKPDLRRMRAAAENIVPSTTGAARAVGEVIPELKGIIDGMAMRVPVPDGSVTDLVCLVDRLPTIEAVNEVFQAAAASERWEGVLDYTDDPIVSSDVIGSAFSCTFDAQSTMTNDRLVKVIGWYDNEWGYSSRLVELVERVI